MALARRGAEDGPVLQLADDAFQPAVGLDGNVLGVLVAHGAKVAA